MKRKQKKRETHTTKFQQFWHSRTSLFVLFGLFCFVAFSVAKEAVMRVEREQEIVQLENEIARLQERNTRTKDVITLLNSTTKQEKMVRSKLGVQKPGEEVVFFPADRVVPEKIYETPDAEVVQETVVQESNPEKWMNYFLGKYKE